MRIKGRVLNTGTVSGEAVVFDKGFSFIGDMDPATGTVTMTGSENHGRSLKDKILVIPTGRGGTIAPYIAYYAKKNAAAPLAILCNSADTITLECALVIDIPIMDQFPTDITKTARTGNRVSVNGREGFVELSDEV